MHVEIKKCEAELRVILDHARADIGGIRTNRPTPKLVEDIAVEQYGERMTVKQVASIMVSPPHELLVNVWDKSAVPGVVKAIEAVGLGLSVAVDGQVIRLHLPPLHDERRKELVKLVKSMVEKERIKMRSARDDANKKIKAMESDEDMIFFLKEEVQKLVDAANKELDALTAAKVKEIEE